MDALRYYFLREIPSSADGDFSERRFKELYNADLANGLGNLVARVAKLAENLYFASRKFDFNETKEDKFHRALNEFRFNDAIQEILLDIKSSDQYVNDKKLWTLKGQKRHDAIAVAIDSIRLIASRLQPFLPETAEKILKQFEGPMIKSRPPLFPRLA